VHKRLTINIKIGNQKSYSAIKNNLQKTSAIIKIAFLLTSSLIVGLIHGGTFVNCKIILRKTAIQIIVLLTSCLSVGLAHRTHSAMVA
jgi:hypothetical protein